MQMCERCLNNVCRGEHAVVMDAHCEMCGQTKDCVICEHRVGSFLQPYIPVIPMALDPNGGGFISDAMRWYCRGHGKEASPSSAREHYVWLWQRRRRLRDRDDMTYHFEIDALQDEMDNLWWNLSKEDTDAIKNDLGVIDP